MNYVSSSKLSSNFRLHENYIYVLDTKIIPFSYSFNDQDWEFKQLYTISCMQYSLTSIYTIHTLDVIYTSILSFFTKYTYSSNNMFTKARNMYMNERNYKMKLKVRVLQNFLYDKRIKQRRRQDRLIFKSE